MNVAYTPEDLNTYLSLATDVSPEHPIVITKFIEGAQEIDVDAVASDGKLLVYAVSQHVENAGVHSGDATLILPPVYEHEQNWDKTKLGIRGLTPEIVASTKKVAEKVAQAFKITGPFNMQLILSRSLESSTEFSLKVIECNLRASRSFPFVSKVLDLNFIDRKGVKAVKCPVFSWTRLAGADPILGVEMASTGEIACFGRDVHEAYFTSLFANHNNFKSLPMTVGSGVLISADQLSDSREVAYVAKKLISIGYNVLVDDDYSLNVLKKEGLEGITLLTEKSDKSLEFLLDNTKLLGDVFENRKVEAVFSFCKQRPRTADSLKYRIRSASVSMGLGYLNDSKNALLFVDALEKYVVGNYQKDGAVKSAAEWFK
jgi:hypothetical protein